MYSLALLYTGRIWMPFMLHLFWNFSQAFYGFNISGMDKFSDIFIRIEPVGNALISGGSYGLEGSLIGIAARFLVLGFIVWTSRMLLSQNPAFQTYQNSILPESLRS